MTMRSIPQTAVDFIKQHEALKLAAYKPLKSDVLTIGYGHTHGVLAGDTISEETALHYLDLDLREAREKIYAFIPEARINELTENQYAALLSFVFNAGLKGTWHVSEALCHGHFDQVPFFMAQFVHEGHTVVLGLVHRRDDERKLWSTP